MTRVVHLPRRRRSRNEYTDYATAIRGVHFLDWGLSTLLLRRYDLVHLNWPETRWTRRGLGLSILGSAELWLGITISRLRKKPLVLTLHNLSPHEVPHPRLHQLMDRVVRNHTDGVVALDPGHLPHVASAFPGAMAAHAPMGAYEWVRPRSGRNVAQPPLVLSHGMQRSYKGAPDLVMASTSCSIPHKVAIIGQFDPSVLEQCRRGALGATHIELHDGWQSRLDIRRAHEAATVVVVPFRSVDNTSSLLLSLGMGVPVAGPAVQALEHLQRAVGQDWVYTWYGAFGPGELESVLVWAAQQRANVPDLGHFSWAEHHEVVCALYDRLVRSSSA